MVWSLIAAGLSILEPLTVLNLAHGSLYMPGGLFCHQTTVDLASVPGGLWIAVLVAPAAMALLGGVIEVFLLRPICKGEIISQYILTFAMLMIIAEACKMVWGAGYLSARFSWPLQGSVNIFGLHFPAYSLLLMAMGPVAFIGLRSLIHKASLGSMIRAVTEKREMANALCPNGALGCTGVEEMCLVPTAPAVIKGIKDAIGAFNCDLPVTPERLSAALAAKGVAK